MEFPGSRSLSKVVSSLGPSRRVPVPLSLLPVHSFSGCPLPQARQNGTSTMRRCATRLSWPRNGVSSATFDSISVVSLFTDSPLSSLSLPPSRSPSLPISVPHPLSLPPTPLLSHCVPFIAHMHSVSRALPLSRLLLRRFLFLALSFSVPSVSHSLPARFRDSR